MPVARAPDRMSFLAGRPEILRERFRADVAEGLALSRKRLPCLYLYDRQGSVLFEEICGLPEYYLTRCEREIIEDRAGEICGSLGGEMDLLELGSGSAVKTRILIEGLLRRQGRLRYVPVDISPSALEESSRALLRAYPGLEVTAVAAEYEEGLRLLDGSAERARLVLWLGSNVGNLERPEAVRFLSRVRGALESRDGLLVGIDLRKDRWTLERAYADSRGVTARFNLNLLARINRELDGHFDLQAFRHRAIYREELGRVEMHLESTRPQEVAIDALGATIPFKRGETIHTESSHKYSLEEIRKLATSSGFRLSRQWLDRARRFSLNLFFVD